MLSKLRKFEKKGERIVVIAIGREKAYTDDVTKLNDPFDDIDGPSLQRLNLLGLPLCREHDRKNPFGKMIYQHGGRGSDKCIIFFVDKSKVVGRYIAENELLKADGTGLSNVSIGFDAISLFNEKDPRNVSILRFPVEVSLVKENLSPGCQILFAMSESELKTKADEYISTLNKTSVTDTLNKRGYHTTLTQWIGTDSVQTTTTSTDTTTNTMNNTTTPQQQQQQQVPAPTNATIPVPSPAQTAGNTQANLAGTNVAQTPVVPNIGMEMTPEQLDKIAVALGMTPETMRLMPKESLPAMMKMALDYHDVKEQNQKLKTDQDYLKKQVEDNEKNIKLNAFELAKAMVGENNQEGVSEIVDGINPFLATPDSIGEMLKKGQALQSVLAYSNSLRIENEKYKETVKRQQEEALLRESTKPSHPATVTTTTKTTQKNYGAPAQSNPEYDRIFNKSDATSGGKAQSRLLYTGSRFSPTQVSRAEKGQPTPAQNIPSAAVPANTVPMQTEEPQQVNMGSVEIPVYGEHLWNQISQNPGSDALMKRLMGRLNSAPEPNAFNGKEYEVRIDRPTTQRIR